MKIFSQLVFRGFSQNFYAGCGSHPVTYLLDVCAVTTVLGHPYWLYIMRTHDLWLLLQFLVLLMIDAESVRNMQSNPAVINKQYCQSCILLVLYITYLSRTINQPTLYNKRQITQKPTFSKNQTTLIFENNLRTALLVKDYSPQLVIFHRPWVS